MSTTMKPGSGTGALDPGTFDFTAYISGTATFPTFKHTVFLDQAGGLRLHRLVEEYDTLLKQRAEIINEQESRDVEGARSFVDDEAEKLAADLERTEARLTELDPQINEVREQVTETALVLHFEAGTAHKLGAVVRQAEKEFHKKHGRKDENDVEYITAKSKHMLVAQLVAYCTGITLADGREQDAPNEVGFSVLLDRLIASESVRLMNTLNESLDASTDWANTLDAGFPGGRADQAEQPVDDPNSEVGAVVGAASADTPDGGGDPVG